MGPHGFHGILAHPHAQTWPRRHLEVLEVSFARSLEVFGAAPRTALGAPILMELDGVPWNSMEFLGMLWNFDGFPWNSMEIYGILWIPMLGDELELISMRFYRFPCLGMMCYGFYRFPCLGMKSYELL